MTKKEIEKLVAECIKRDLTDAVISNIEKKIDAKVQQLVAYCIEKREDDDAQKRLKMLRPAAIWLKKHGGGLMSHAERFPHLYEEPAESLMDNILKKVKPKKRN